MAERDAPKARRARKRDAATTATTRKARATPAAKKRAPAKQRAAGDGDARAGDDANADVKRASTKRKRTSDAGDGDKARANAKPARNDDAVADDNARTVTDDAAAAGDTTVADGAARNGDGDARDATTADDDTTVTDDTAAAGNGTRVTHAVADSTRDGDARDAAADAHAASAATPAGDDDNAPAVTPTRKRAEPTLAALDEANAAAAAAAPIDGRTLDEIRREVAEDKASDEDLLALAKNLKLDDDDEPEAELVLTKGPVFEGEVPLATPEERADAMLRAARRIGLAQLHPEQEQVLETILRGEDVLMVLPTGFGKSACYQIPSLIFNKPVLVISPLLALMKDQFDTMERLGLPVIKLDSQLRGGARKAALAQIASGGRLLVMTTPETLTAPDASKALAAGGVALAAVDEAHCISEWGYDFRPAYLQIGERLRGLGAPPALALTATATTKVRSAIIRFVGLREPRVVSASPHRDNLAFDVLQAGAGARLRALARLALRVRRPGIIYCSTTRDVDEVFTVLQRFGVPSYRYHGKMSGTERRKSQEGFMTRGRRTVMVATNAFGLGIDKPDIRYVMHYQSPASLEQYVQEAGRAGRDGRRANCIMLFAAGDRAIHEALLARSRVRPEQLYKLAKALSQWAQENKVPTLAALALTADLGSRTCAALLALLEESELVKWSPEAIEVLTPPEEFEERARALGGQFQTLRSQDARRLDAVHDYALLESCRATMLEEYFGEESSGDCGICDHCRGGSDRPTSFWEPLTPPRTPRGKNAKSAKNGGGGTGKNARGGDARKQRHKNTRNGNERRGYKSARDGGERRTQWRDGERRGYKSGRDGDARGERRGYKSARDGDARRGYKSAHDGDARRAQTRSGESSDGRERRAPWRDGERRGYKSARDGDARGERRGYKSGRDARDARDGGDRNERRAQWRDGERRGYKSTRDAHGAHTRNGERDTRGYERGERREHQRSDGRGERRTRWRDGEHGDRRNYKSARDSRNESGRDERGGERGGDARNHNTNGAYKTRDDERRGYKNSRDDRNESGRDARGGSERDEHRAPSRSDARDGEHRNYKSAGDNRNESGRDARGGYERNERRAHWRDGERDERDARSRSERGGDARGHDERGARGGDARSHYERGERGGDAHRHDTRGARDSDARNHSKRNGGAHRHDANGAYTTRDGDGHGHSRVRDGDRRGYANARDGERRSSAGDDRRGYTSARDSERRNHAGHSRDGEPRSNADGARHGYAGARGDQRRADGDGARGRHANDAYKTRNTASARNERDGERTGRPRGRDERERHNSDRADAERTNSDSPSHGEDHTPPQ